MDDSFDIKRFRTGDYVVFLGMLASSMLIGIYYAVKDRNKKDMETYYLGGQNMSPIPLGLSISVTFVSAITIIGFPAETYFFGTVMMWFSFTVVIPVGVMCVIYIPLIHKLKLYSIYEYIELRFHAGLRKSSSAIMCSIMIFYMSLTIYVPALALSAVTSLDLRLTIILTSMICTIYTTLGGMKAVVWTDTFQTMIMLGGVIAVLIKTTIVVGGFQNVWDALERGGRLNMMTFNPDPTLRNSFWTIIVGSAINFSSPNQAITQRYLSCKSIRNARIAALVSLVPSCVFMGLSVISGTVMYAYFESCDPLMSGKITKPDQMMPYLVVDVFQGVPGMAGLFVAAGFSGTLSTVSSGINSLAALITEDFIIAKLPKLSQAKRVTIGKVIVLLLGTFVTGISLLIEFLDGTIVRILHSIAGVIGGPLVGIFTLGLFFPWCTTLGAVVGQITSTALMSWIATCSFIYGKSPVGNRALPASVEGCISASNSSASTILATSFFNGTSAAQEVAQSFANNLTTDITFTTKYVASEESHGIETTLYALSFFYYGALSLLITFTVGLLVSFVTGANDPAQTDPRLFMPMISNPIFPAKVRQFFRFGVPYSDTEIKCKDYEESDDENSLFVYAKGSKENCVLEYEIKESCL